MEKARLSPNLLNVENKRLKRFCDFVLFHANSLEYPNCLRHSRFNIGCWQGSGVGHLSSEMKRAPFKGFHVIIYLGAGTDLAQPIKVMQDSYIKS
jgi:hypothetical protein